MELKESVIYFYVGIKNFEMLAFLHAASCMVMVDFKLAGLKLMPIILLKLMKNLLKEFQSCLLFFFGKMQFEIYAKRFYSYKKINNVLKVPAFFIKDTKNHRY